MLRPGDLVGERFEIVAQAGSGGRAGGGPRARHRAPRRQALEPVPPRRARRRRQAHRLRPGPPRARLLTADPRGRGHRHPRLHVARAGARAALAAGRLDDAEPGQTGRLWTLAALASVFHDLGLADRARPLVAAGAAAVRATGAASPCFLAKEESRLLRALDAMLG